MPVVTATVFLHLKEGSTVTQTGTPDADGLKKLFALMSQQKGFVKQFWGVQIEDPSIFIWSIDWEDIADHKAFMNSDAHKTFVGYVIPLFDLSVAKPFIIHANFTDGADAARQAPVTEFAFFMLSKEASDEQKSALEDSFLKVTKLCTEQGECSAFALGWILEEFPHEQATEGKAINLLGLLGWPSKEAHLSLSDKPEFVEGGKATAAMALPGKPGKSMFHVKFQGKRA